jgi:hypothetical protein
MLAAKLLRVSVDTQPARSSGSLPKAQGERSALRGSPLGMVRPQRSQLGAAH